MAARGEPLDESACYAQRGLPHCQPGRNVVSILAPQRLALEPLMRIFRLDDFVPLVSEEFRLLHPSGTRIVRLTEAKAVGSGTEKGGLMPSRAGGSFSLYFEGAIAERFDQGLFGMEHDQLGAFDIFLVPIKEQQGRRVYEAVFN